MGPEITTTIITTNSVLLSDDAGLSSLGYQDAIMGVLLGLGLIIGAIGVIKIHDWLTD